MHPEQRLDALSECFIHALFQAFPQWMSLAREVDSGNGLRHIEVDIPQEGATRHLNLSTATGNITITFDGWHTHVGPFLGMNERECAAMAITIIDSFITENTVVVVETRDGKWVGSRLEYLDAPSANDPTCMNHVYSWRGTHDRVQLPVGKDHRVNNQHNQSQPGK